MVGMGMRDEQAPHPVGLDARRPDVAKEPVELDARPGIDERRLSSAIDEVDVAVGGVRDAEPVPAARHDRDTVGQPAHRSSGHQTSTTDPSAAERMMAWATRIPWSASCGVMTSDG